MNAAATITFTNDQSGNLKRRSLKSLDKIHQGGDKSPSKRTRKRTCAIDSTTDLLLDSEKDGLLSTCAEDRKDCSLVLREEHVVLRYQTSNDNLRFFYDKKETFRDALELFNRSYCFLENGVWQSRGCFFECKGPIRVIQRMCTRCRDIDKPRTKTDLYYVDLAERFRERTILCHGCMGRILFQQVGTKINHIQKQLNRLQRRQECGIYIYSRGNQ